jgi:hypothetical protein
VPRSAQGSRREFRIEVQRDASKRTTEVITTMRWGCGKNFDNVGPEARHGRLRRMTMTINTQIGPGVNADGRGPDSLRLDRQLAQVVALSHGTLYEQASAAATCSSALAPVAGVTVAAGHVAPPAAAAATTLSLYNPVGERVQPRDPRRVPEPPDGHAGHRGVVVVHRSRRWARHADHGDAERDGRAGAGGWRRQRIAKGFAATALTGGPLHTANRQFPSSMFAAAIAATSLGANVVDVVDGGLVLPPGYVVSLCPPAAGTSHVVAAQILFAQVAIPS